MKLKNESELLKSTFSGMDETGNNYAVLIDLRVQLKAARSVIR